MNSELEHLESENARLERCVKMRDAERSATYKVLKKYGLTTDGMCLDTMVEDAILKLKGAEK